MRELNEQRQYYGFLDVARLYCALLIIFIHMGLGNTFSVIPCLSRQGVPFFFLASGFFFAKKARNCEDIKSITIQYIKPMILVYFVWILLWLPATVIEYKNLYQGSIGILILVLCRRILLAGIAPYWYLLVLAEGIPILAVILRRNKLVAGAILCIMGIVLGIIYGYQSFANQNGIIYKLFYTVFSWNNNVIMSGFPLLFLGAIMDLYEKRIRKVPFWLLLVLYIASIVAAFLLYAKYRNLFGIPFGIIQAVLLFSLCITGCCFQQRIPARIGKKARNLSSVVFLTHTVALTILGNYFHIWDSVIRYIITALCAITVCWVAEKLNRRALNTILLMK